MESRDRVIVATLNVIRRDGIKAVTIRRVAEQLGHSTTVVTHYFKNRQELIQETLRRAFDETRAEAEAAVQGADDQLWAFLDWAISPEHAELWETLMAAHVTGVDEEVSKQVESLLNWWDAKFQALVSGRAAPGYTPAQLCDIAGTVVEGILLSPSGGAVSGISGKQILRATLSSLVLEPR